MMVSVWANRQVENTHSVGVFLGVKNDFRYN